MTENVIEQLVNGMIEAEMGPTDSGYVLTEDAELWGDGRVYGLMEAAKRLQAATRPEQFMPPLSVWPELARWCAVDANGAPIGYEFEPELGGHSFWDKPDRGDWYGLILHDWPALPLGIDWRTLKVSREQMERWEANQ